VPPYPFAAVVGLADLRMSLLLNAVSPAIGGVLVRGEKGTAKSTMVRALAALLPPVATVAGCRFACDPGAPDAECPDGPHEVSGPARTRAAALVDLPLGATEDRVVGALDLERALTRGEKAFEPGLLARAHRGFLYIDEANLLEDHLVDLLLDVAASGENVVEREGLSVRHPARFVLVGSGNPEEGELRPQLLDRFGLAVDVTAPRDIESRTLVVQRRLAYDADPYAFVSTFAEAESGLAAHIARARTRLPSVVLPERELRRIAGVCAAFGVDGMRADIVVARTAMALAAWHDRPAVTEEDVADAARLALPHRRRRDPFDAPGLSEEDLTQALRDADPEPEPEPDPPSGGTPPPDPPSGGTPPPDLEPAGAQSPSAGDGPQSRVAPADAPYRARLLSVPGAGTGARAGRRSAAYTRGGRVVGARRPDGRLVSLHLPATVLAAAPYQASRGRTDRLVLRAEDLRATVHKGREANLVLFVVDASGSMAARQRMRAVKGAVLSLLRDAYQRRDKVGLVTFRGSDATLALPPTTSHEIAALRLRELPTGGRTPLAAGLRLAATVLAAERRRDPERRPLLVLVTDGRSTTGPDPVTIAPALSGVACVVVDCESGPVRLGLAHRLATVLGGPYLRLEELSVDGLRAVATDRRRAA
jgi:magnesium chelatase subunit D